MHSCTCTCAPSYCFVCSVTLIIIVSVLYMYMKHRGVRCMTLMEHPVCNVSSVQGRVVYYCLCVMSGSLCLHNGPL